MSSFPFQFPRAGSQTSALMSESAEGLRVKVTRQCAGSWSGWLSGGAPGGRNGPASADMAEVTVAEGNVIDFSCSQGAWAWANAGQNAAAARARNNREGLGVARAIGPRVSSSDLVTARASSELRP